MRRQTSALAASLFALSSLVAEESFNINLKDPVYENGVVKTDQGGVITAPDLRIQARHIHFVNRKNEQTIAAHGDLLMEYEGRIFTGEKLQFDLLNKTGYLVDGRSNIDIWYVGGNHIALDNCGCISIDCPYATTSASRSNPWEIQAKCATVDEKKVLRAKDVTFRFMRTPLFWLPAYSTNLTRFSDPPIRYRATWDKGLGPKLSLRYRFLATENFAAYLRFDYRFKYVVEDGAKEILRRGPGVALEAEYNSKDKLTQFQTKNYIARDKIFSDKEKHTLRYRYQGIYKSSSKDNYSKFHLQWDKLHDDKMVGDFKDSDFELNTQKTTYLEATSYQNIAFGSVTVRPRINDFDSFAQELPTGVIGIRPITFWNSGFILENYASGSYLDYTYTNKAEEILKDRESGRLETINTLYRPLSFWGLTATPRAGIVGIYYSKSPQHQAAAQFLYTYGGDANFRLYKQFNRAKHVVEPYANFVGYSRPHVAVDDYFVFSIHDGYDKLNQLRFGVRQLFYSDQMSVFVPTVVLDTYAYSFWGARSFDRRIPKAFIDLQINQPSFRIFGEAGVNIQENLLDYGNIGLLYTLSSTFAFGVELRHRSKFWWRKAIHDNYVVDFARSQFELLHSPLSDGRNTFLTKAHWRLSPRWNMQLQTHHGWGRKKEDSYNGARLDFYTMLTGSWQMKLSYEYMPNDPFRISYSFKLIK